MSRLFDDAASDRLTNANAVIVGYPFTLACWFNSDNIGISQVLMSVGDTGTADNYHYLRAAGSVASDPVQAGSAAGGTARNAATTTGYSTNTWHHACGVFTAAADRAAFIDGGSKGTNTQSTSPAGVDATAIGRLETSTPANHMSGMIAEAAIWDVALTDAEVALLAASYSPLLVRPQNLVAYWPLIGRTSPEIDTIGRFEMTVTGAVVAAHPRIRYPVGLYAGIAIAGGTTYNQSVSGALSFSGSLTKQTGKVLTGSISPTGTLLKQIGKLLSGALSISGDLVKQTGKLLSGALSPEGGLLKQVNKVLSGDVSFSGTLNGIRIILVSLTGSLSFSGSLTKQTNKVLGGSLSFSGGLTKLISKALAGTLSFVGSLSSAIIGQVTAAVLTLRTRTNQITLRLRTNILHTKKRK